MLRKVLPATVFCLWWVVLALALKAITLDAGTFPVDYRTYAAAAERAEAEGSPYVGADAARARWLEIHRATTAIFRLDPGGELPDGSISGPYLYPPTLALVLGPGRTAALVFVLVQAAVAAATCLAWLRLSGAGLGWWLVPAALSVDILAVFAGGNVEVLLIGGSLLASWLLWTGRGPWAAPVVAAVLLVKPQYGLLFVAFACLAMAAGGRRWRPFLVAGAGAAALIALEFLRWPAAARADFLAYAASPSSLQYFALPPDQQWPMSLWNRASLQLFLGAGLPYGAAQALSLGIFAVLLAVSCRRLRRARAGFAPVFAPLFALAYVLFLLTRPITWALPFLGLFAVAAVWPGLAPAGRRAVAAMALLLGATHWAAYMLFLGGAAPGLLTLQSEALPWETLLVLPATWALLTFRAMPAIPQR